MNDDEPNIVQQVIMAAGGYGAYTRLMDRKMNTTTLREVAAGKRIPTSINRERIVKASRGRLTERDIINISGREVYDNTRRHEVDPMWEVDEDERRRLIHERAAAGAKRQLRNNQRRLT